MEITAVLLVFFVLTSPLWAIFLFILVYGFIAECWGELKSYFRRKS